MAWARCQVSVMREDGVSTMPASEFAGGSAAASADMSLSHALPGAVEERGRRQCRGLRWHGTGGAAWEQQRRMKAAGWGDRGRRRRSDGAALRDVRYRASS